MSIKQTGIDEKYRPIIKKATVTAAGIGIPGALVGALDMAAISAVWIGMIIDLAKTSGHEIGAPYTAKLVASMLAGAAAYMTGSKILTYCFHLFPGIGTLTAIGINSVLNALYTYKLGKTVAQLFDEGGVAFADMEVAARHLSAVVFAIISPGEVRHLIDVIRDVADQA